jgi:sulfate transport system substrate-binding protein
VFRSGRCRACVAAAIVALSVVIGLAAACSGDDDGITLVAYTTPREVYEELIPAFADGPAGEGVRVYQSYGPSGDQSRIVESGLDADVVALALEPDIMRLVDEGLVDADWAGGPTAGFVSNSVVVLAVRPGNPEGVRDWDDLLRDDIEVITPNPLTSGGAQWNVAAAYGAQLERGRTHEQALEYLAAMFANVDVQPKGSREALQIFRAGKGDVLIAYENEAITARQNGEEVDYVIPDETILIQNPIAVTSGSGNPAAAEAFVRHLLTPSSQGVFADKGYRPVLPSVLAEHAEAFPEPPGLFTIEDVGGWDDFRSDFFSSDGYMVDIFAGDAPGDRR